MPIVRVTTTGTHTTAVFDNWCSTIAPTASTYNSISVFQYWVDECTATAATATRYPIVSTTNCTVFVTWMETVSCPAEAPVVSDEERERVRLYAEECDARRKAEEEQVRREKRRANRRALVLLLRTLVEEQRRDLKEHGHFYVRGGATGTRYRIRKGRSANIDVLEATGDTRHRLCAHPNVWTPDYDTMAAQALHLTDAANEAEFIRIANIHPVMRTA